MEEIKSKREYDELRMPLDDDDKLATEATIMGKRIFPPDGYLVGKITQTDNGMLVEYVEKKPKYPTTYEECNRIMCVELWNTLWGEDATEYEEQTEDLINTLIKLKVCRDAYWKIAGEQMGLGKPWESPLPSLFETVYCIRRKNNEIIKGSYRGGKSEILEFPTEEMRDAFFEDFKDLIEQCKELL